MDNPPRQEFGRRNRAASQSAQPAKRRASSSTGFAALEALMGAQPMEPEQSYLIVPIKPLPVVAAAVGLLVWNLAFLALEFPWVRAVIGMLAPPSAPSAATHQLGEFSSRVSFMYVAMIPVYIGIFSTVGYFAAVYSIGAQAPLRWLRWTSPLAFSLGGASTAYVYYAGSCLLGSHATISGLLSEVLGGALCAWIYRVAAGTLSVEPTGAGSAPLPRDEAFEI